MSAREQIEFSAARAIAAVKTLNDESIALIHRCTFAMSGAKPKDDEHEQA